LEKHQNITPDQYHICMTPECEIVYYNKSDSYTTTEVSVPVWYKTEAKEKFLCYCSSVRESDIGKAIKELNTKDVRLVMEATGAMKNCDCLHKNPTGKCCSSTIADFIKNS
jgi:bacterioferritin-associated ferredoxin